MAGSRAVWVGAALLAAALLSWRLGTRQGGEPSGPPQGSATAAASQAEPEAPARARPLTAVAPATEAAEDLEEVALTPSRVQVDDAGGGPVPGATVEVVHFGPPKLRVLSSAITDEAGRAEVGLPDGKIRVNASADGYMMSGVDVEGPQDVRIELQPAARLAGQVVGPDGEGVEAKVTLWGKAQFSRVDSDARGHFAFEEVRPGQAVVGVLEGPMIGEAPPVHLAPGASVTDVRLEVMPPSAVLAKLSYEDGAPCPEPWLHVGTERIESESAAHARADAIEAGQASPLGLTAAELRAPGVALVESLPPGRYEIETRCESAAEGIVREETQIPIGVLLRREYRHPRLGRVEGTVKGAKGPAKGAWVRMQAGDDEVASATVRYDGNFALAVPPGNYSVRAEGPGRPPEARSPARTVQVVAGSVARVELVLEPVIDTRATLTVLVRRPSGESVEAGVRIYAQGESSTSGKTDASGQASLLLEPGHYAVDASNGTKRSAIVEVDVPETGAEVEVRLEAEDPKPTCEGVVVDEAGEPVADARLAAIYDPAHASVMSYTRGWLGGGQAPPGHDHAVSDLAGRFEIELGHERRTHILARSGPRSGQAVCGDSPMTIVLRAGRAQLEVVGPVAGATLHFVQLQGPIVRADRLDAQGRARLEGLPEGPAAVVLDLAGQAAFAEVTLRAGETAKAVLKPRPLTRLTGRVLDEAGEPAANGDILMHDRIGAALDAYLHLSKDGRGGFASEAPLRWPVWLSAAYPRCPILRWAPGDGPIVLSKQDCKPRTR